MKTIIVTAALLAFSALPAWAAEQPLRIGQKERFTLVPLPGGGLGKWFEVRLVAGGELHLEVSSRASEVPIGVYVYTPGNRELTRLSGGGSVKWTSDPVPASGSYRILVSAREPLDVDVLATLADDPNPVRPDLEQQIKDLQGQIRRLEQRIGQLERRAQGNHEGR